MDITGIYRLVSIIGYSLAALLLILSIAIFFLYDIKGVYSYLTGKKKQKGINELRENQASGKLSSKLKKPFAEPPKKIEARPRENAVTPPPQQAYAPSQPAQQQAQGDIQAASQREYGETAPLGQNLGESAQSVQSAAPDNNTVVLSPAAEDNNTVVLSPAAEDNNTVVLSPAVQETAQAYSDSIISSTVGKFVIVKKEMVIHTSEVL